MELNQLFACYLLCLSEQLVSIRKLLLKATAPSPTRFTALCQCHIATQWAQYELLYSLIWNLGKLPSLTVPQTLSPCTVYKAGFLLSYHLLFFLPTLQYNSSSANYIPEVELWEALAVLHLKDWISPISYTACVNLFLALYNLTMHDKLHDPTSWLSGCLV